MSEHKRVKNANATKDMWITRAQHAEMEAHDLRIEVCKLQKELAAVTVWQIIKRKVFGK